MAWWSRKKPIQAEEAPEELDVVLDVDAPGAPAPPQTETLFDADAFHAEFAVDEESEPEVESDSEVEPVGPAPDAGSEAEGEPEAGPDPDPVAQAESVAAHGEPEEAPRPPLPTHARRRAHGRSRRAGRSRADVAEAAIAPSASAVAEAGPEPTREAPESAETPKPRSAGRMSRVASSLTGAGRRILSVGLIIVVLLGAVAALPLLADGINWLVRWNKLRTAGSASVSTLPEKDNLLVIGVSDGVVVGFVAMKAERATAKVLGIAIPDGAFVEVPGQGFERVGASYLGGPQVSEDAISNFFGVPFRKHVVIDGTAYQALLRNQDVSGLMSAIASTDLTDDERASFATYFASVAAKDVWIVPLPVKPVAVGDQRYFEPQKKEIADLLLQWWGVEASQAQVTPRIIVYNGVGTPGLAGVASQQLIRAGFRIVDSGNAGNFDYATTEIHLFHGTQADADAVRASLGVGRVIVESAPQDLTDMIVIIGSDYRPPTSDVSTVPTEGVQ